MIHDPSRPCGRPSAGSDQRGIALIMTLVFTILLYVLIAELVMTARMSRMTGENDALLAEMRSHQIYILSQVEDELKDDLAAAAAGGGEGGGAGALGGALGGASPGGGGEGGGEGGEGEEPVVDGSQDSWFEPVGHPDDNITTYVWTEDENRKFNLLTLISEDREFARESRERFVRIIDAMREDTEHDLSSSDGERLADRIVDWMRAAGRSEDLERPMLKSDGYERRSDYSLPLVIEELLMLDGVKEDLYYDRVIDERLIPGLESHFTVYTAMAVDPGDPDKQRQREASQNSRGVNAAAGSNGANPGAGNAGAGGNEGANGQGGNNNVDPDAPLEPIGQGIRININTAPRAVLRGLFSVPEMSDGVLDAILRFRNEEVEEDEEDPEAAEGQGDLFGDYQPGSEKKRKVFEKVEDLENVEEFANSVSAKVKEKVYPLMTVNSDVFSIHMASLYKRNEERRIYTIRRAKSVVMRLENGDDPIIHPLILLEETNGMRVKGVDFPDDFQLDDFNYELSEMDQFSAEERRWNPFFLEFYRQFDESGQAR